MPPHRFRADEHPQDWVESPQRKGVEKSWVPPALAFGCDQVSDPPQSFLHVQSHIGSSSGKFNTGRVSVHTRMLYVGLVTGP